MSSRSSERLKKSLKSIPIYLEPWLVVLLIVNSGNVFLQRNVAYTSSETRKSHKRFNWKYMKTLCLVSKTFVNLKYDAKKVHNYVKQSERYKYAFLMFLRLGLKRVNYFWSIFSLQSEWHDFVLFKIKPLHIWFSLPAIKKRVSPTFGHKSVSEIIYVSQLRQTLRWA